MGEKNSVSIETECFQEGRIKEVVSSSVRSGDTPEENADGGIREPITTVMWGIYTTSSLKNL